jgi:hypothetical protein
MGGIFLKALPLIKALCQKTAPPFVALINKAGKVALANI